MAKIKVTARQAELLAGLLPGGLNAPSIKGKKKAKATKIKVQKKEA